MAPDRNLRTQFGAPWSRSKSTPELRRTDVSAATIRPLMSSPVSVDRWCHGLSVTVYLVPKTAGMCAFSKLARFTMILDFSNSLFFSLGLNIYWA